MAQKRGNSHSQSSRAGRAGRGRTGQSYRPKTAVKRGSGRRQQNSPLPPVVAALFCALCLIITLGEYLGLGLPTWNQIFSLIGVEETSSTMGRPAEPAGPAEGILKVHFIDVGQGDSILIQTPEQNILIDAGENNQGETVGRYLRAQGVSDLDLVIGTHPHSDHIGGMDDLLEQFPAGKILMPALPDSMIPTTRTYTDLLAVIEDRGVKLVNPKVGDYFDLGGGASLQILGPNGEFNDLNLMSIVSRLTFGETAFLFTGDAEEKAEAAMLNRRGLTFTADVLDAGHHGSSTSTSKALLEAVSPRYAAISVGADNEYGHPHQETMKRFADYGVEVYRTDLDGAIVFLSDGKEITVKTAA